MSLPALIRITGIAGPTAANGLYYLGHADSYWKFGGTTSILWTHYGDVWNIMESSTMLFISATSPSTSLPLDSEAWFPQGSTVKGDLAFTVVNAVEINDIYGLQGIQAAGVMGGTFIQTANIDASPTDAASPAFDPAVWNAAGFLPIGNASTPFIGTYDGGNYTLTGLTVNRPATNDIGLFGSIGVHNGPCGSVRRVRLRNVNVTGNARVGALCGDSALSTQRSSISDCSSTGLVTSNANAAGGLIGRGQKAVISRCWSSCTARSLGATADYSGGLVANLGYSIVEDSYATGSATAYGSVGGFVGQIFGATIIRRCYSTGKPTAGTGRPGGGFIGFNYYYDGANVAENCCWNKETAFLATDGLLDTSFGKTTALMKTKAAYDGWDFETLWDIDNGRNNGYPFLNPRSAAVHGTGIFTSLLAVGVLARSGLFRKR
jgi:hypothetical protein